MPCAELAVSLPDGIWIAELSCEYPNATFRVLAALPADETGVGLVEIRAENPGTILDGMRAVDDVVSLEVLQAREREALVQFETTNPLLLLSLGASGVPLELPITIQDGIVFLDITAPQERLSELGSQLRAFGMSFEVRSLSQSIDATDLLTPRQRSLLVEAVECGYYDTPRTCTLTDLAESVGVAKSTASETLHRAEESVIKQFVTDLPGEEFTE